MDPVTAALAFLALGASRKLPVLTADRSGARIDRGEIDVDVQGIR